MNVGKNLAIVDVKRVKFMSLRRAIMPDKAKLTTWKCKECEAALGFSCVVGTGRKTKDEMPRCVWGCDGRAQYLESKEGEG